MPPLERFEGKRLYGRRKGPRLSARRQALLDGLLPRLRLDLAASPRSLAALFEAPVTSVALEIGFGAGEHVAWQAAARPARGFIACEVYLNGVAALLARIEERGLRNVRIHHGDAREALAWLPDASLDGVYVLFPDPWPKKRHHKRRLIDPHTLADLARVLRPGAEFRLASDIGDYIGAALLAIHASGAFSWTAERARDWRTRPPDWPQTRYERKALEEGRRASYLTFLRR